MKEQENWNQEDWNAYYSFLADEDATEIAAIDEYAIDFLEMEADY